MHYSIAKVCIASTILISVATPAFAQKKNKNGEYWTAQVETACSNVPPYRIPTEGVVNLADLPSREESVNNYFNRLLGQFKKRNFDYVSEASDNFIKNWPGNERQKQCASTLLTESQAGMANQEKQEAEQKVQAKKQAASPAGQLKTVYISYMLMQACYEARKEFRVPYVSKQEFEIARAISARKEQELLNKFPMLAPQKDALWEQSKQKYLQSTVMDLFEAAEVNGFVTLAVANDGGLWLNVAQMFGNAGTKHSDRIDRVCKGFSTVYTTDKQQQHDSIKKDF